MAIVKKWLRVASKQMAIKGLRLDMMVQREAEVMQKVGR